VVFDHSIINICYEVECPDLSALSSPFEALRALRPEWEAEGAKPRDMR